jgi:hypothetical protein
VGCGKIRVGVLGDRRVGYGMGVENVVVLIVLQDAILDVAAKIYS